MSHLAYIALGSNLENPLEQVAMATAAIKDLGEVCAVSSWYQSKPIGPEGQNDYINGALLLRTELKPYALLEALQAIENQQGRTREIRWGARTLDLDILLYDDINLDDEKLTIPHPRMHERNFVIAPLAEINPQLQVANKGTILELLSQLGQEGLEKLA